MSHYDEEKRTTIFTPEEEAEFRRVDRVRIQQRMIEVRAEDPWPDDDKWMWPKGYLFVCTVLEFRSRFAYVRDTVEQAPKWDTEIEAYTWFVPQLENLLPPALEHLKDLTRRVVKAESHLQQLKDQACHSSAPSSTPVSQEPGQPSVEKNADATATECTESSTAFPAAALAGLIPCPT